MEDISVFENYVEKKLVSRKGTNYTMSIGNQEIILGKSKVDANQALIDLISAGKLSPLTPSEKNESQDPLANSTEDDDDKALQGILPISPEVTEEDDIQAALGKIIDIKPSNYIDTDVFYKGVNVMDKDNPVIKKLPVVFRWRKRGENNANVVDDGHGNLTCNNWQVLMRDRHAAIFRHLKFMRNETPNGNFAVNGDLVYCVARKDLYEKLQNEKSMQGLINAKKDKERRMEIGKNIAKLNDEEQALELLEQTNSADESTTQKYEQQMEALKAEL